MTMLLSQWKAIPFCLSSPVTGQTQQHLKHCSLSRHGVLVTLHIYCDPGQEAGLCMNKEWVGPILNCLQQCLPNGTRVCVHCASCFVTYQSLSVEIGQCLHKVAWHRCKYDELKCVWDQTVNIYILALHIYIYMKAVQLCHATVCIRCSIS